MVPLNRLPKGNVLDEWYPVLPPSHSKMEVGSIRVRSKFTVSKTDSSTYSGFHLSVESDCFGFALLRSAFGLKKLAPLCHPI